MAKRTKRRVSIRPSRPSSAAGAPRTASKPRLPADPHARLDMASLGRPLLRSATLWTVRSGGPSAWHTCQVFEIVYLQTGNLTWELADGTCLRLHGGDVAVLQPGAKYHAAADSIAPCAFLALGVEPCPPFPCHPFCSREELAVALDVLRKSGNGVVRGLPAMEGDYLALREAAPAIGQGTLSPLETLFLRGLLDRAFVGILASLTMRRSAPHYDAIRRACLFIERHLTDRIPVPRIAQAAGMSVPRLHELFHLETGETPAKYHERLRLELAQRLLRDPRASITDVALNSGFCSGQHFSNRFRKHFGLSPTAWRRALRGGAEPTAPNAGQRVQPAGWSGSPWLVCWSPPRPRTPK